MPPRLRPAPRCSRWRVVALVDAQAGGVRARRARDLRLDGDTVIVRMDVGRAGARPPDRHRHARDRALGRAGRVLRRARGAADAAPRARPAGHAASPAASGTTATAGCSPTCACSAGRTISSGRCSPAAPRARSRSAPNTDRAGRLCRAGARGPQRGTRAVGRVPGTLSAHPRAHADRGAACDGRAARARPGLTARGLPIPQLQRRRLPAVDPAAFRLRLYHR